MFYRSALCILIVATSCVAAVSRTTLAPADEYFGRFKLSILGIANTIRDSSRKLDGGAEPREVIEGPLAFAEDAIRDWQHKYPRDHWIPRDLYALEQAYLHVSSDRARALAARTEDWLERDYPESEYVAMARGALADR